MSVLDPRHPTALVFLDETGAIASDRFFAVGCLKLGEPSLLVRRISKLRDRRHWYQELHWAELTRDTMDVYKEVIDAVVSTRDCTFSCFIADRDAADPVARFGSHWKAYEKMATQLLIGSVAPHEIVCVLADDYSTPDDVTFEIDVRHEVNSRLGRCAVTSMCRMNSQSSDGLQAVDILTSAVAFEFRQAAGLAGTATPKAEVARYMRDAFGVSSWLRPPAVTDRINVRKYVPGLAGRR